MSRGRGRVHTDDAGTDLIIDLLYPRTSATDSAICSLETLSGPPTFRRSLWLCRNDTVFNDKFSSPIQVIFRYTHWATMSFATAPESSGQTTRAAPDPVL